jgi:hypothetical protein
MAKETGKGIGWFYLPFAVLPFCLLGRMERTARNFLLGLIAVFVGAGPLMVALLNPSKDLASLQNVAPFFFALNVVLSIWTGLGLVVVGPCHSLRHHRAYVVSSHGLLSPHCVCDPAGFCVQDKWMGLTCQRRGPGHAKVRHVLVSTAKQI